MESNPRTNLYRLDAKRPWWSLDRLGGAKRPLLPGDRTAVRPDREDDLLDRWLIVRVPIGGDHMGMASRRQAVLYWEESLFNWLDVHPTAMWDGHELGCGEFKLYLLTASPNDLLHELCERPGGLPAGASSFEQRGPEGDEHRLA